MALDSVSPFVPNLHYLGTSCVFVSHSPSRCSLYVPSTCFHQFLVICVTWCSDCVLQDVPVGTEVITALAESRVIGQPAITYSLIDTNNQHDFRINAITGKIFTNATLNYDRTNVYLVNTNSLSVFLCTYVFLCECLCYVLLLYWFVFCIRFNCPLLVIWIKLGIKKNFSTEITLLGRLGHGMGESLDRYSHCSKKCWLYHWCVSVCNYECICVMLWMCVYSCSWWPEMIAELKVFATCESSSCKSLFQSFHSTATPLG